MNRQNDALLILYLETFLTFHENFKLCTNSFYKGAKYTLDSLLEDTCRLMFFLGFALRVALIG